MTSKASHRQAFQAEVRALSERLGGMLGFCARSLASGESIGVNDREPFPMASTYKIPIAAAALSLVDRGQLSLSDMVPIDTGMLERAGPVAQSVIHPGVSLSVANLIELMLTQSNNNATDRILELAGGPMAVTSWLRRIGLEGMRVDNSTNDLLNQFFGFEAGSPSERCFLERWPTQEERDLAIYLSPPGFDESPQDSGTPLAMVDLLERLFARDAISSASSDFLFGVMSRCATGMDRIPGMLPPTTLVARKTGTIGGTINDAGVIVLPGSGERIAIAVCTKGSRLLPLAAREIFLAEISRSVFDYFRFR